MPAVAPLLRAVTVRREMNSAASPRLPRSVPTAFVRERWPRHVLPGAGAAGPERRYYELCVLSELRAGDVRVAGRRRYRSLAERLVSREALREGGTLSVAVEAVFATSSPRAATSSPRGWPPPTGKRAAACCRR